MRLTASPQLTLRLLALALLGAGVAAFVLLGGLELLSFEQLVARKDALVALAAAHPVAAVGALGLAYVVLGTFCLPGVTALHISGGLLFGFWAGLGVVGVASTIGTICGFFTSRLLLRELVERLARGRLREVEDGIAREGGLFVFAFRLMPVVPYSVINAILGACPIRFSTYVWVSFVASLPRYVLYVMTGTQLDRIRALEDVYSPTMVATLGALGLLPFVVKRGWRALEPRLKARREGKG
jgi:uncharacterized membrane protein YdjX (TVP38/TMEM64 family)